VVEINIEWADNSDGYGFGNETAVLPEEQ